MTVIIQDFLMIGHISEPKHMTAKALFVSYTLSKSEKLFTNI